MKCIRLLCLVLVLTFFIGERCSAQVSDIFRSRLNSLAALIGEHPGGYDTLFAKSFLTAVPPTKMNEIVADYLTKYGPVSKIELTDSTRPYRGKAKFITSKNYEYDVTLAVTKSEPHLIEGLLFGAGAPAAKSLEALGALFKELGSTYFYVVDITEAKDRELIAQNASVEYPLGSAFKLFVLARLIQDVEQGKRKWSDVVMLDSTSLSLPSGKLHQWPTGSPLTLFSVAALMISESDNTATDLLIHTLGRKNVEQMLRTVGHSSPELNVPLLTTLEMFKLKSIGNEGIAKGYRDGNAATREKILQQLAAMPRDSINFNAQGLPRDISTIEWFGSGKDISRVIRWIRDHTTSSKTEIARKLLAINPGLNISVDTWRYVGYKGGSEPGVLNMTYLLQSDAGNWYVLSAGWKDEGAPLAEDQFFGLMQRSFEMIEP